MNQNTPVEWSKTELVIFRFLFCYLIFYFIFLSNFFPGPLFPFLEYVHAPFKYISDGFIGLVNRLFIHKKYDADIYTGIADSSWFIMASISYLSIAILVTIIWTFLDKRKSYNIFFVYLQTYARYYLAFVLFLYGFDKLFGNQFPNPLPPDYLIQSFGNIDPHTLLWGFMGASKSYNFFAGLIEIIPAILLLFRRTTTLGALIALAALINVLFLDIGYDTLVKSLVIHLILISLFILSPDIKRLFSFFLAKRNATLTTMPGEERFDKYPWIRYGVKFIVIAFVVFKLIQNEVDITSNYSKSYLGGLDGAYEIKEFYMNQQSLPPLTTDTVRWRKIAINKYGGALIQFMNDSTFSYYMLQGDTATKSIQLSVWNDSTFKGDLHYSIMGSGEYVFEGKFKNDSIRVVSRKIDLNNLPLIKDRGKIKWVWW